IFAEGTSQFQNLVGTRTSTNISAIAVGSFDSYDFRSSADGPFDPQRIDGSAVPSVNHLDFYMTIPKTAAPPNGYPIVIFAHGLGGSGRDVINVPRAVGDAPLMGIGISALHTCRRGDPGSFFNFDQLTATREYLRQTVAD